MPDSTPNFPLHTEETAPEEAKPALAATRANFGMIPNLERVMASAPALLASYSASWDLFDTTSLSPIERQVVYQTANYENECNYCVPWHSYLAKEAGMEPDDLAALRTGADLPSARLQALHEFTRLMIANRGKLSPAALQKFLDAGYTEQNALEVVLGLAVKTMSNFTNSIAGTPLDSEVASLAWEKPRIAMRERTNETGG